ncbi:MAG: N-methyl-L-tryptophan oxidase [Thaumarchaeota archaeon]|nr:MAG: N-methyl-L-tryptophan oxidase [Nitrososphaerota archaeon]
MKRFETIVVGCGGMGSSISYHLSRRGARTLVLERFKLNHENGSSHGRTKIIRTAYFEDPRYVRLAKRAFQLWAALEKETGRRLLEVTGGLMIGKPDSPIVVGSLRSAREFSLPHSLLDAKELAERFPAFAASDSERALYEPNAGILFPDRCIEAHKEMAEEEGTKFHFGERVTRWEAGRSLVTIHTEKETYAAEKVIFAAGPWNRSLLPDLRLPLECERQVIFWFRPSTRGELFNPRRMPIFGWEVGRGRIFYGIPNTGHGVKAARHHGGRVSPPDEVDRRVTAEDEAPVRTFLKSRLPLLDRTPISSMTCTYTNTPDGHFVIDRHPRHRNIWLVSPCSGHGFKFSSVIGEIVSELALRGFTRQDISLFSLARLGIT